MLAACARRRRAPPFIDPSGYAQHRPETTLLYRLIEQHYADFRALRAHRGVGGKGQGADQTTDQPITPRHAAMT